MLSESAFSVLVPILERLFGRQPQEIRAVCEFHGLTLQEWEQSSTNPLVISDIPEAVA